MKKELATLLADKADTSRPSAYSFLSKLDNHGILEETKKELGPSKPEIYYSVDRPQLLTEIKQSDWYSERFKLWRYLLEQLGDF